MVNPDGHEYSRTEDRLWRKNRRPNADGSIGVDPNRNYGYMWGTLNINTSSHVPSDPTYVGPRAFSEPETRAVRNLVARELFRGVITYHSYSQLILYPWGYTSQPIPDTSDLSTMTNLAERMQELIGEVHGKTYSPQQSSQLYPRQVTRETGPTANTASRRLPSSYGPARPRTAGSSYLRSRSSRRSKRTYPPQWSS